MKKVQVASTRCSASTKLSKVGLPIGREVAESFKAWFVRNFVNPRAGRIGGVSYLRAGALDDRPGNSVWYSDAYGRAFWDHVEPLSPDEEAYILSHPLVALQLALGVTDLRGLRCLRRGLTLRTNSLQRKAYRSRYYARDNARRRWLAAERRRIRRRTTTNPCPSPDAFRAAFARVGDSAEAKILFGGMVHDLACYVDSCLRYDEAGSIVGRNGGIKAWIADNVPELRPRYKTIMRYKALAMRVRQAVGLEDPVPTSALLDENGHRALAESAPGGLGVAKKGRGAQQKGEGNKNYYAQKSHNGGGGKVRSGYPGRLEAGRWPQLGDGVRVRAGGLWRDLERKRKRVRRILADCKNSFRDVLGRIDAVLGEEETG